MNAYSYISLGDRPLVERFINPKLASWLRDGLTFSSIFETSGFISCLVSGIDNEEGFMLRYGTESYSVEWFIFGNVSIRASGCYILNF